MSYNSISAELRLLFEFVARLEAALGAANSTIKFIAGC
jgi:hypothetical protein